MATALEVRYLIDQKLEIFERLQAEFEACFQFVAEVHGQKRFAALTVDEIVRYLHSLWICELKGRLLSVSKTVKEYQGRLCLELLRNWQVEEDTVEVVAFLHHKLDMLPLVDITRQIREAQHVHSNDGLVQRLTHGRLILLNRGMNLMQILDAIFSMPENELLEQVRIACEQMGHLPAQIATQLEEMDAPIYSYLPHPVLAKRNMEIMNKLGVSVTLKLVDLPGQRSWRILSPTEPLPPFAEYIVTAYREMT
jgi:hypothetical protein